MGLWKSIVKPVKSVFKRNRTLPAVTKPTLNSNYSKFMGSYGWVFQSANRSAGDYDLYYHAENNVFVYRSIQVISDSFLINGFSINNPNEEMVNFERTHYLTQLFNNPSGWVSDITHAMFLKQYVTSFELTGDAFIEVNYEELDFNNVEASIINGFEVIPPQLLRWFPDTEQWGYRSKPSIRYEDDELIHIYEPSLDITKHGKYGVSKLEKIRLPIIMMWLGLDHNRKILENDGLDPRAILSFDKDITDESFEAELERLALYAEERKKGGTLAVKGATFQSSESAEDMDFLSLMTWCRDMILTAYGVQPGKAGIRETANLGTGTGESQDKDFKDMMNAKARLIEDAFNKKLGHNGFQELFQFNEIDIVDKLKRTQIEMNKLNSGVVTVNEVRRDYGLEPVPWGDVPNNISTNLNNEELLDENNVEMLKRYKNNVVKSNVLSEWSNDYGKW